MKNLATTTEKNLGFGNTVRYAKTFNTNVEGRELTIGIYRRVINCTDKEFRSKTYFTLVYKNEHFGHNDMDRKAFDFTLGMINEGCFDKF